MPKLKPKACKYCNRIFIPTANAQEYCDSECKYLHSKKKRLLELYYCDWCGTPFRSIRKKKYCCKDCRLYEKKKKKQPQSTSPDWAVELAKANQAARDAGTSYGKYYGLLYAQQFCKHKGEADEKT